jgi:hypothetical protein
MRTMPTWPAGAQVLLREIRDARTWCARPVTVLHDGRRQAVLRIHVGTNWLAAYRPNGRRAHTWHRRWELGRAVWHGHEGTYVIPWHRWYGVAAFVDADTGDVAKWYVNCQLPLRRTAWGFDTLDRELDVVLPAPGTGRLEWKDRPQLARLVGMGGLAAYQWKVMLAHARQASRQVADPGFRDRMGRWLGPAGPVPDLDRLLVELPVPADLRAHADVPARTGRRPS